MDQNFWNEYKLLYQTYEGYNDQVIQLKAWSVTIGIAALIAAYTKPVSSSGRIGVIVAALSAIPFWLTESFWKLFQGAHLERLRELELCARSKVTECISMQIVTSWKAAYESDKYCDWFWIAISPHVWLPHAALLVFGLVLAWKWPPSTTLDT